MPVLNPVPLMLGNLNKRYLLDLEKAGVPIVPTLFFRDVPEKLPWNEVVLKPAVSASSHLTFRLSTGIEEAARKILERSEGLAQPFMREIVDRGEISAIYHKAKGAPPNFSHAIIKRPASGDFRVQAEFGGKVSPLKMNEAMTQFCDLTLSKIRGEWLYARIDFVETAKGPLLCELELVEPYLFYDQPGADLNGFAAALKSHLA
jgi:glutathione synthase/RimK-type ligase-like ATP-grasp enzyme